MVPSESGEVIGASSPLVAGDPTIVDFTTIGDWSIEGLLRVETTGNDPWSLDSDTLSLQLIRYSTPSFGGITFPTVTSILVVPEPSSGLLLALGLIGLASTRRRP